MGAHGSKEKLQRSASERYVHNQVIERERFGSFGKRVKKEGVTKKRDTRTINSSPCDLGVFNNTNPNGNILAVGSSKSKPRPIVTLQKRTFNQQNGTVPASQIGELKSSPITKKVVPRQQSSSKVSHQEKSPFRDHNDSFVQTPAKESPKSSMRNTCSTKPSTPPSINHTCNGISIHENLKVSSKFKVKELENNNSHKIMNKNNSKASKMHQQVLQQILDQESICKQKKTVELMHASKGVEALGILIQYLVFNLDAFSCHSLKRTLENTSQQLTDKCNNLKDLEKSYQNLSEQLYDREKHFEKRESELHDLHRCEIANAHKALEDLKKDKLEKLESLENDMKIHNEAAREIFQNLMNEAELKIASHEAEVFSARDHEKSLVKRIHELTITENELREKVHKSEIEYSEKLNLSSSRERNFISKINHLTKQLEEMKVRSEIEKRDLEEKLNLSNDELLVTRKSRTYSTNESFLNKTINISQSQLLEDEVESLRCVLELKQREISDLRKQNGELQRAADESLAAQAKCSALESRVEDLQVQLGAKHEEEKELLMKFKQIQDQHDGVIKKSTRLSLHNEELQWRLKQNAERYSHTISELSKSYQDQSGMLNNRTNELEISCEKSNSSIAGCADDSGGISPPASPMIKGVVEKCDSVSWVLEMDDETPEVLANRLVRRAGSFRSEKCSPSPVPKKQKCQNNSSIKQSASATSILRQCSEPLQSNSTSNIRLRSKSLSANKIEPKNIVQSTSSHGSKNQDSGWSSLTNSICLKKEPDHLHTVDDIIIDESNIDFFLESNVSMNMVEFSRQGASKFGPFEQCEASSFFRDNAPEFKNSKENRGLITCDTAVLSSSEMKKIRSPKIGAGEAMVSGSNSEDEEISDSSSIVSTGPSSPSLCSSLSSSHQKPVRPTDGLSAWKTNMPIEVSWSEVEGPSESNV